jgi:hypothetical protein
METMSDTPETDEHNQLHEISGYTLDFCRKLERERDEWQINALLKLAVKQLACMWCGEIVHAPAGYEPGTPLNKDLRGQAYREHVATCAKHPIRDVERERDEAREHRDNCQLELQIVTERLKGQHHPDDNGMKYEGEIDIKAITEQRDRLAEALQNIIRIYENPAKNCIPCSSDMYDEALQSLTTTKQ